jgi:Mrp family chromosome partitioning ATPase
MQSIVELLRERADVVIFDSPPLLAVADAAVLSASADGALLVIDASRGRRRQVQLAVAALERSGANILGAVLNRVAATESFHYAGHYGESDANPASRPLTAAGTSDPSGTTARSQAPR